MYKRTIILAVCALLSPFPSFAEDVPNHHSWRKADLRLGAHRGGRELWPENTLYAYRQAVEKWPHILLEGDLHITADGEVVIMHDAKVDRTTDGNGAIAEKTLAEMKALDAGYRFSKDNGATFPYRGKGITVPTLEEVLAALPNQLFMFEIKQGEKAAERVVNVIQKSDALGRVMLASFNPIYMHEVRSLAPDLATCFDYANALKMITVLRKGDWENYRPTDLMLAFEPSLLQKLSVTPIELNALKAKGVLLQAFTLNTEASIRENLALGVDSILTDKPDLLAQILGEPK